VAQVGATIGHTFSRRLLSAVAKIPDGKLATYLEELVQEGVLTRQGQGRQEEFVFKQKLFQEVAYETLLRRERQELHGRIADALTDLQSNELSVIAEHKERAGRREEAITLWQNAASSALGDAAPHEAMAHLQRALALHDESETTQKVLIHLELAAICRMVGDLQAGHESVGEVKRLTDEPEHLARAAYYEGSLEFQIGDGKACERAHSRALELAQKAGSAEVQARALSGLGDALYMQGRFREAIECAKQCTAICQENGFAEIETSNTVILSMPLYWQLKFDEVEALLKRSSTLLPPTKVSRAKGLMLFGSSILKRAIGELDAAQLAAAQSGAIFRRLRSRGMEAATIYFGLRARRLQAGANLRPLIEEAQHLLAGANDAAFNLQLRIAILLAGSEHAGATERLEAAEKVLPRVTNASRNLWSYDDLIEYSLLVGDWPRALRLVKESSDLQPETLPWIEFLGAMAQALAAHAAGDKGSAERLDQLHQQTVDLGWKAKTWILEKSRASIDQEPSSHDLAAKRRTSRAGH
jgi:tetratricopeptide (TPR) repeat protein